MLCNWRLSAGQAAPAQSVQGLGPGQRTQSGDNNMESHNLTLWKESPFAMRLHSGVSGLLGECGDIWPGSRRLSPL